MNGIQQGPAAVARRRHEVVGVVHRQLPLSDLGCYWSVPASTLNIGGLYGSVRLGFHF
jgi:hypothetical protein